MMYYPAHGWLYCGGLRIPDAQPIGSYGDY
jgi:hypothetical protein